MLNLAVKKRPPRSPTPSGRRAHFTSSLPVYSSRKSTEDQEEEEDTPGLSVSLPPTPATLPLSPSPGPENRDRSSSFSTTPRMRSKSQSLDVSLRRRSSSLGKRPAKGQSLDLSGILRSSVSQNDVADTLNVSGANDDINRQSSQQTKNLVTRFDKVEKVLQPGYDRIVRATSQTYPFVVGLKTVDQLPVPSASEETGISWVCNIEHYFTQSLILVVAKCSKMNANTSLFCYCCLIL